MTAPEPTSTPDNPELTAEEIGKRFLKLIEGLESRSDLSLKRIRESTGITLTHEPGTLGAGYWSHELGGGWRYALTYYPESPSLLEGVGLSFEHSEDHITDVTPVCDLDFEYYHNALVEMGFMAEPYYGEHNLLLGWRYTKFKKSDGTVDMTISVVQMAGNEPGHLCVKSVGTLNGR